MKRRVVIVGIVVIAAFVGFGIYYISAPKNIAQHLRDAGVAIPSLNEFTIIEVRTSKISDLSVISISAQKDEILVRLKLTQRMGTGFARLYEQEKRAGIESLFITQPAHYPGIITREVECSLEFQPDVGTAGDLAYYIMYANERFSFGVCSPDLVTYRFVLGFGYCEQQSIFVEIKMFYSPESFSKEESLNILRSFACG